MLRKGISALILSLSLASCVSGGQNVNDRMQYWEERINREVPPGSKQSELVAWLEENDIDYRNSAPEFEAIAGPGDRIHFHLEKIDGDGWACGFWVVEGQAVIKEGTVARYEVSQAGSCL